MTINWNAVQAEIKSHAHIAGPRAALLKEIKLAGLSDCGAGVIATLKVGSLLSLRLLEQYLLSDLKAAFEKQTSKPVSFEFEIESRQESFDLERSPDAAVEAACPQSDAVTTGPTSAPRFRETFRLSYGMTLSTFVVTAENRFATCAIEQFISSASCAFSCLALQGPSGVGKTHLLHAAGWRSRELFPSLRVKVLTGDDFITDFQTAIAKRTMGDFRRRYRMETDLLLLDDVHSLAKAKGTQEELFNLMNALAAAGKKLVLTCDRSMEEIEGLEDRVRSRVAGGLVIPIARPSAESRRAILDAKLRAAGLEVAPELVDTIARAAGACVRSVDGVVHKLGMLSRLNALNRESILALIQVRPLIAAALAPAEIMAESATKHGLTVNDLRGPSRAAKIVAARKFCMRRLRDELGMGVADIGRLHNRDHSTVLSALKRLKS